MAAFAEGMMLRDYSFDRYKADDEDKEEELDVRVTCDVGQETELSALILTLAGVASGVHLSRDLGNMPPNDMYPEAFADQAWEWAKGLRQCRCHHHQLRPSSESRYGWFGCCWNGFLEETMHGHLRTER